MAKARAIIRRRKTIQNIRKITRTMELISTARFKRALDRATQAEAYTRKISELVRDLSASALAVKHPLLAVREQPRAATLLVICANRGLCGGYNANVLGMANRRRGELKASMPELRLEVAGKRGISYFRYRGVRPDEAFTHFEDRPRFEEVEVLADRYLASFLAGKLDRLDVAYMRFLSASKQVPRVETLLPLGSVEAATAGLAVRHPAAQRPQPSHVPVQYEFLPSAADILAEVLPISFKVRLFKCFLDAAVSEQIARMVAMKGATENAGNMIRDLTMRYNRARQAQITKELAEIMGGAEALK